MRVLHLVHTPGPGGTETVVANLLAWMPPDVVQAVACPAGYLAQRAADLGRAHFQVDFPLLRRSSNPVAVARSLRAARRVRMQLWRALEGFRPDIVHAHAAKAAILARDLRSGRPWVLLWHLHDYVPLGAWRRLWIWRASRADGVVAVSADVAEGVGVRAVVVPNAVEPPQGPPPGREASREAFGLPSDSLVFGYAGRLDKEKGIPLLWEAFAAIRREEPRACLLVAGVSAPAGSPQESHKCVPGAGAPGVHMVGRLPTLEGFFAALDVFIHPAPREPFGLVILEALARGVPVVVQEAGGAAEVVGPFDRSLLVRPRDATALARRALECATDEGLRERVRAEGPRYVASRFGPPVQCEALCRLYRRVLAG